MQNHFSRKEGEVDAVLPMHFILLNYFVYKEGSVG